MVYHGEGTLAVDNVVEEFYVDDTVYKFDHKLNRIAFGLVQGVYGNDVGEDTSILREGQIRVHWDRSYPVQSRISEQCEVQLMSRSFSTGEVVKRPGVGKETHKGLCTKIEQMSTVQIMGTDDVVEHVTTDRFYAPCTFNVADAVCLGEKVGRIKNVESSLNLRFTNCGSRVKILSSVNQNQIHNERFTLVDHEPYQVPLMSCIPSTLVEPLWLNKSKTIKMEIEQDFVVESTEDVSVEVCWLLPNGDIEFEEVKGDDVGKLKVLHHPYHRHVVKGQIFMMKLRPSDVLISECEWLRKQSLMLMPDKARQRKEVDNNLRLVSENIEERMMETPTRINAEPIILPVGVKVEVLCVETKVTVLWQDGTEETEIPSTELYLSPVNDDDFFPGYWVTLNQSDEDVDCADWGVVQSVDFAGRTAKVRWSPHNLGYSCSTCGHPDIEQSGNFNLTVHSVDDLVIHDKCIYDLDNTVYKLTANGAMLGRISDILPQNGSTIVQWSDGSTKYYFPGHEEFEVLQELCDVDDLFEYDEDGEIYEDWGSCEDSEAFSEATSDDEMMSVDENMDSDETPEIHPNHSCKFEQRNLEKFADAFQHEEELLEDSPPVDEERPLKRFRMTLEEIGKESESNKAPN